MAIVLGTMHNDMPAHDTAMHGQPLELFNNSDHAVEHQFMHADQHALPTVSLVAL